MTSIATAGSTGLVGSHIVSALLSFPNISAIHALTRRNLPLTSPKLHSLSNTDTTTWSEKLSSISPTPSIFLSALGTTRAAAGSFAVQRTIDYDLNLALATAASNSRIPVYVLISTGKADSSSMFPYLKMKGELEDAVKKLPFKHVVIVRPLLILGAREDTRLAEFLFQKVAGLAGWLGDGFKDSWAADAEVIGRAAVAAGLKALEDLEGEKGVAPKIWVIEQADVVRLGRTEWKDVATDAA